MKIKINKKAFVFGSIIFILCIFPYIVFLFSATKYLSKLSYNIFLAPIYIPFELASLPAGLLSFTMCQTPKLNSIYNVIQYYCFGVINSDDFVLFLTILISFIYSLLGYFLFSKITQKKSKK